MKKVISIISVLAIVFSIFTFSTINASAASTTLRFSSSSVEVGSQVTVTAILQNGSEMLDASCKINYNESVLRFDSGNVSGGAGVLTFVSEQSAGKYTISVTFTAIAVGESTIQVKDCLYTYLGSEGAAEESFAGQAATITVKDKALSNNANLKSLSLNTGTLSPKFSASRTTYTATVPYETTKINVTATAADSGAKVVSVSGNNDLKVGKNSIVVTVQAADGTQKKYTINVTRLNQGESLPGESTEENETEQQETKLDVEIAGTAYTVATEIPEEKLLKGFTISTAQYNETDVPVAVDDAGVYTIYYLKAADSEELLPYTYNQELKVFERLKYMVSGENVYIFQNFPSEYALPENMYLSNVKIGDFSVECLLSNDSTFSEMHYIYCYANGNYALYRYDSLENTIQRCPEIKLENIKDVVENDSFFARFKQLSTNGRVILIGLFVAILGAVALIVILIIYLVRRFSNGEEEIDLESFEEDFDEIIEEETEENTQN